MTQPMVAMPKYWAAEQGGEVRRAIEQFLRGEELTAANIAVIRNYLRQWIFSPVWDQAATAGADIEALRQMINSLTSEVEIDLWLDRAARAQVYPL